MRVGEPPARRRGPRSRRSFTPSAASPIVPVTTTAVAGLGGRAPHHPAVRHGAERRDRDRQPVRACGRCRRRGADSHSAPRPRPRPGANAGEPRFVGAGRQRQRQQKAERPRALGGEIGKIHAQRLAGDPVRRIVGEKVHAGNDAVGRQHKIAARRRRDHGGIIGEAEGARMRGERPEIARDQALFGRFR